METTLGPAKASQERVCQTLSQRHQQVRQVGSKDLKIDDQRIIVIDYSIATHRLDDIRVFFTLLGCRVNVQDQVRLCRNSIANIACQQRFHSNESRYI